MTDSSYAPKLSKHDPVGWYLCDISGTLYVFHWDGINLCDQLPHKEYARQYDPGWNRVIDCATGPMVFVDIDFPSHSVIDVEIVE